MVYWVELEKMQGIRERAGYSLIEARRYAGFLLKGGRYGKEAYIYQGQKWVGTCILSGGKTYYESVFGKRYILREDGIAVEINKRQRRR